ncbi:hypothetical protein LC612_31425 [Nostoc sp. CHAB 5834]|nr:hypothetical protein [Nostoc sp. CHAB 5834]
MTTKSSHFHVLPLPEIRKKHFQGPVAEYWAGLTASDIQGLRERLRLANRPPSTKTLERIHTGVALASGIVLAPALRAMGVDIPLTQEAPDIWGKAISMMAIAFMTYWAIEGGRKGLRWLKHGNLSSMEYQLTPLREIPYLSQEVWGLICTSAAAMHYCAEVLARGRELLVMDLHILRSRAKSEQSRPHLPSDWELLHYPELRTTTQQGKALQAAIEKFSGAPS